MKKIFSIFTLMALLFASCDPLEDIYSEVDKEISENEALYKIKGNAEIVMTDEDYEGLELTDSYFTTEAIAKVMISEHLLDLYPTWGKLSSALVTYHIDQGDYTALDTYTDATKYSVSDTEYPTAGAKAFYPTEKASDFANTILGAAIDNPVDGDVRLLKYETYLVTPLGASEEIYFEDFTTLDNVTMQDVAGDTFEWGIGDNGDYGDEVFAEMSAYPNEVSEDWIVSNEIDLSDAVNSTFQIKQYINYAKGVMDAQKIMVSTDYSGDVTTATWTEILLETRPEGSNHDFITSELYDLSAYDGDKIHIGFKYIGTDENGSKWRIDNFSVKAGAVTPTVKGQEFYTFKFGKWRYEDEVYMMQAKDYNILGDAYGQPGYFDNFSSSAHPSSYMPAFMRTQAPFAFAQEGDEIMIAYDYFSGGAQIRGTHYTFVNGMWNAYQSVTTRQLQFAHDGQVWVPDNTIEYQLVEADYSHIVATLGSKYPDVTSNMDTYGNFNGFSWEDEQITEALGVALLNVNPDAAIGQKYAVTYSIYEGSTTDQTAYLILAEDSEGVLSYIEQ
jgi:hypothetical protein